MRIIQSSWSCNQTNLLTFGAGWFASEYNLMSLALSCLQLRQYYNDVTLYADSVAAKMFIDELRLPYTNVVCSLDNLNNYHPQLWALPKIVAYKAQESPFLHVDGDVFIWQAFDDGLLQNRLIAQNEEEETGYYRHIFAILERNLVYFPEEILEHRKTGNPIHAFNAGIFGGTDIAFFKDYSQTAIDFVKKNYAVLNAVNVINFNIFFEQYLFYCIAKKRGIKVSVLLQGIYSDNQYAGFGDFSSVPYKKQYLHLLGVYKRNKTVCKAMAAQLRQDYPEYYYRIIALFKNAKVPLFKDYYYLTDHCSESDLMSRHASLKNDYRDNKLNKVSIEQTGIIITSGDTHADICATFDEKQADDLKKFYAKIHAVQQDKFIHISNEYLYGRDLNATKYCRYIFENIKVIYEKVIVADDIIEMVESRFDWTGELNGKEGFITAELEEPRPEKYITAMIPECDKIGFSVDNIDELDVIILQALQRPATIHQLFEEVKNCFDADELEECKNEFEKLIFGRIKKGLVNKSIKCLMPDKLN